MTCDRCQHMARIRAALAPCQSCDCAAHNGASHVQANDRTLESRVGRDAREERDAVAPPPSDPPYVTSLDPDAEDAMRRILATVFQLSPLDLLLVRHMFNGGALSNYGDALDKVGQRIARMHGTSRAQAYEAKKRIAERFPELGAVLAHLVKANRRTAR